MKKTLGAKMSGQIQTQVLKLTPESNACLEKPIHQKGVQLNK